MTSWQEFINSQRDLDYMKRLQLILRNERKTYEVYPSNELVFHAMKLTPFDKVRVILMAQDPYIHPGQANGMAFSVPKGVVLPPSIQNIYKELQADANCTIPTHGDLTQWAEQGVLLINSMLTVRRGVSSSHAGIGWERFTDAAIKALSDHREGLVFCLWGNFAKAKRYLIDEKKHYVLEAYHPVSGSDDKSFLGCRHFTQINQILEQEGNGFIDWQIT